MGRPAQMPRLGARVRDRATGIDGTLVAVTSWFDRSDEAAIFRLVLDADGRPWPIHWLPAARLVPEGSDT